jgi:hypothetical protein
MIKIENVLKEFGYEITAGADFLWKCFGDNAWSFDYNHVCVTFDKKSGEVFMLEFDSSYGDPSAVYRWVAPEHELAHYREAKERGFWMGSANQCYSYSSFLKMAKAAHEQKQPDFELLNDVELFLDPELLEQINAAAALKNQTLDEFVADALEALIAKKKREDELAAQDTEGR